MFKVNFSKTLSGTFQKLSPDNITQAVVFTFLVLYLSSINKLLLALVMLSEPNRPNPLGVNLYFDSSKNVHRVVSKTLSGTFQQLSPDNITQAVVLTFLVLYLSSINKLLHASVLFSEPNRPNPLCVNLYFDSSKNIYRVASTSVCFWSSIFALYPHPVFFPQMQ